MHGPPSDKALLLKCLEPDNSSANFSDVRRFRSLRAENGVEEAPHCCGAISGWPVGRIVAAVVGYAAAICFDPSRPDGTTRKWLDVSRLAALGWHARNELK